MTESHANLHAPFDEERLGRALQLARVGLIVFMVAIVTAIAISWSWFSPANSFLSELGCFNGAFDVAAWLFTLGLGFFGVTMFWLFHVISRLGPHVPNGLRVCAVANQAAGVALVMVGVTPFDVLYKTHVVAMSAWLVLMVAALVGWLDWIRTQTQREGSRLARYVTFAVGLYPVACLLSLGPLLQKFIVVMAIGWLGYFFGQIDDAMTRGEVRAWLRARDYKSPRPHGEGKRRRPTIRYVESPRSDDS